MKTKFKMGGIIFTIILATAAFVRCNKEPAMLPTTALSPANGKAFYNLYLKDSAASYQEVNVNIVGAKIHDTSGWINVNIHPGVYDLLRLSGGIDTLLGSDTVAAGYVSQLRLILADTGNTVEVSNTFYPLTIPSGDESGLKINIDTTFTMALDYDIMLDFNAGKSVIKTGSNTYILKPVIKGSVSVHPY